MGVLQKHPQSRGWKFHLCTTASAPIIIKTKSEGIRGGLGRGDGCSQDNRSTQNYTTWAENQEVAQSMQDFLNWEKYGGEVMADSSVFLLEK